MPVTTVWDRDWRAVESYLWQHGGGLSDGVAFRDNEDSQVYIGVLFQNPTDRWTTTDVFCSLTSQLGASGDKTQLASRPKIGPRAFAGFAFGLPLFPGPTSVQVYCHEGSQRPQPGGALIIEAISVPTPPGALMAADTPAALDTGTIPGLNQPTVTGNTVPTGWEAQPQNPGDVATQTESQQAPTEPKAGRGLLWAGLGLAGIAAGVAVLNRKRGKGARPRL